MLRGVHREPHAPPDDRIAFITEWERNTKRCEYYIGDDMKLKQVFINLLGNAVKFTSAPGSVSLTVERTPRAEYRWALRFIVKDTGIAYNLILVDLRMPGQDGCGDAQNTQNHRERDRSHPAHRLRLVGRGGHRARSDLYGKAMGFDGIMARYLQKGGNVI